MMTTIPALYAGTCQECGGRWAEGDLIRLNTTAAPGLWMHAVCPTNEHILFDAIAAGNRERDALAARLAAVEALADKMANENGQSWNSISARRVRAALGVEASDE